MLGRAEFDSDEDYFEQFDDAAWRANYQSWRGAILSGDSAAKSAALSWFDAHPHPNDLRTARQYQRFSPSLAVKKVRNLLKF